MGFGKRGGRAPQDPAAEFDLRQSTRQKTGQTPSDVAQPGSPGSTWRLLRPLFASGRYGNVSGTGLSFTFTPSPSRLNGNTLKAGIRIPKPARRKQSVTSSVVRRPFGQPPLSP